MEKIILNIWYSNQIFYRLVSYVLVPISLLYLLIFYLIRILKTEHKIDIPIICIGNYHIDKKIKELMKVCEPIELKRPTDRQMSIIIEKSMPEFENNLRLNMNSFLQGDLRKLSSIYEIYRNQHSILKNEIIQKIFKPKSHWAFRPHCVWDV